MLDPIFLLIQHYSRINFFLTQHLFRPNILLDLEYLLRIKGKIECGSAQPSLYCIFLNNYCYRLAPFGCFLCECRFATLTHSKAYVEAAHSDWQTAAIRLGRFGEDKKHSGLVAFCDEFVQLI